MPQDCAKQPTNPLIHDSGLPGFVGVDRLAQYLDTCNATARKIVKGMPHHKLPTGKLVVSKLAVEKMLADSKVFA